MTLEIVCPVCSHHTTMAKPARASGNDVAAGERISPDMFSASPGGAKLDDVTCCAGCLAFLQYKAEGWVELPLESMLDISDDDRIALMRLRNVLERTRGRSRPKPPEPEACTGCGEVHPEGHENRLRLLLLGAPAYMCVKLLETEAELEKARHVALGGLQAMEKDVLMNDDSVEQNAKHLTALNLAQQFLHSDGTLAGWLAEALKYRDSVTAELKRCGIDVAELDRLVQAVRE